MKNKINSLAAVAFTAAALCVMPDIAHAGAGAGGAQILSQATSAVTQVYQAAVSVVYILGAIGLMVMAVFAFLGRFKWVHFLSLCGGLFLVAGTNALIQFLGGSGISTSGMMF